MASLAKVHYGLSAVSHNSHSLTEVESCAVAAGGTSVDHSADADTWIDFIGGVEAKITWNITSADLKGAQFIPMHDDGALVFTVAAKAAGSAVVVTVVNSVVLGIDYTINSKGVSVVVISGESYSVSGSATPISYT